ncbi:purine-nucleoside phosphorylase [Bacillus massiliigorillae]|uniref:purine-nucleoside phosphorylase n=1 Tax=Bacillus massiliigorillae TaxID=1243664 RepID=UPI00039F64B6|nr:purine-nucleoside phosphorylase [Bacillus massiliigorillae]
MSFHIEAKKGYIAETVLLPGDPKRAKYIADTYLEDVICYNNIRGVLGYTGLYKGKRISVQGTGMGMPSMSIYTTELIQDYDAKNLIRIGSSGTKHPDVKQMDLILAMGACTNSNMNKHLFGNYSYAPIANFELLRNAFDTGIKMNKPVKAGLVVTDDQFYDGDDEAREKLASYQVLTSDMETAALYTVAAKFNVKALSILTVTDHDLTNETITSEEREKALTDMIELALETSLTL